MCRCVKEFTDFMYNQSDRYITFPFTEEERIEIAEGFEERYGYPNCIGCIDGSHIPILCPSTNEKSFVNRKNYHSINLMVSSFLKVIYMITFVLMLPLISRSHRLSIVVSGA